MTRSIFLNERFVLYKIYYQILIEISIFSHWYWIMMKDYTQKKEERSVYILILLTVNRFVCPCRWQIKFFARKLCSSFHPFFSIVGVYIYVILPRFLLFQRITKVFLCSFLVVFSLIYWPRYIMYHTFVRPWESEREREYLNVYVYAYMSIMCSVW
jgi:hypothetical protein